MLHIGTSGWSYKDWGKAFYPPGLPPREQLTFLARTFPTVEINATFYRLPPAATFEKWFGDTPPDFRFAVKLSRTITHLRRLEDIDEPWQLFLERAKNLKGKLGVILVQFPPSFRATAETRARLEAFMDLAVPTKLRLAYELRHASWFEAPSLELFSRRRACVVQAESSRYPHTPPEFAPADFTYYRFHGPRQLYGSQYTDEELQYWAEFIRRDQARGRDVFAYFDNDMHGYALEDARRLRQRLAGT